AQACSGVEGVPDDVHARRALVQPHGDHVEPAGHGVHAVAGQVIVGDGDYLTPLPPGDGVGTVAALSAAPRLHFDEHQAAAVHGDDVDFADGNAITAGKDCVPFALQCADREIFSAFTEFDVSRDWHVSRACK